MKIITWNINGYRSAEKNKHFSNLIRDYAPDIICIQELKMNEKINNQWGYYAYYNFAKKKGYSGTVVMTLEKPLRVVDKIGLEQFDDEGRFLLLEYNDYYLINVYIPHGGRNKEMHPYKFAALNKLLTLIKNLDKMVMICGDFNIAHTELDLKNFKTNYNNNMFSLPERMKIDELLNLGVIDSFRYLNKEGNIYSVWPNAYNARERNMGWRIDYIFINKGMEDKIKRAEYLNKIYGSDHCPYLLEIDD